MKVNNIGIDSLSRVRHGTIIRVGFTVDDGRGERDQVGSYVMVHVPNEVADPLLRDLLGQIDEHVKIEVDKHMQEWEHGAKR